MKHFFMNKNSLYASESSISSIIHLNKSNGSHFFEPSAMRFFNSRIHSKVYGGCIFVTSEKQSWRHPRKYTVRIAYADGSIESVSSFQQYSTKYQAHQAAKLLSATGILEVK